MAAATNAASACPTAASTKALGPDGKFQVNRDKVAIGRPLTEDEVDFDTGFLIVPSAIPVAATTLGGESESQRGVEPPPSEDQRGVSEASSQQADRQNVVRIRFQATRDQVFKVFPAVANLADRADSSKVTITVEANRESGFDRSWLRNAVEEPLDEADIEREES